MTYEEKKVIRLCRRIKAASGMDFEVVRDGRSYSLRCLGYEQARVSSLHEVWVQLDLYLQDILG